MLQQTTSRNWYSYTAYVVAAIVMILSALKGHSYCTISSVILRACGASHGPSASAELLVCKYNADM